MNRYILYGQFQDNEELVISNFCNNNDVVSWFYSITNP